MTLLFNRSHKPRELLLQASNCLRDGAKICLATLVNIEGNAPYPVGSQMLVDEGSRYWGQITGGCAEQAIADQAVLAIEDKINCTQRFGLDSPYFDIKLPCGSGIDVYFDVAVEVESIENHLKKTQEREPSLESMTTELGRYEKVYLPTQRLIVVGQGPIVLQLSHVARQSGFDVACIVQNTETALACDEHSLLNTNLVDGLASLDQELDERTALVSLFHEHDRELDFLEKGLQSQSYYLGALGSRKTHENRLAQLHAKHGMALPLDRIHGPVGLNIGAQSPEQIAISITAHLIQELNEQGL